MSVRAKKIVWCGAILLLLAGVAATLWTRRFQRYTPVEVALDLKAAMGVKDHPRPVERFLELRYGSLDVAGNRHRAFLDFFNPGHVEGLQILTRRLPAERRQRDIEAMAQWVAGYRRSLTTEDKRALATYFKTPQGRRSLQEATAKYLAQDVYYRGETAPVIRELMTTLSAIQAEPMP